MLIDAGPDWCLRFPTERTTASLVLPFRRYVQSFIGELERRGCTVTIAATRRPAERAFLMHWSWRIAREGYDVRQVPNREGIDIRWSILGARAMVSGYGLVHRPSLTSRHIEGKAIDMRVDGWTGTTSELHHLGASYGVIKLASDPPHWSTDGK